MEPSWTLKWKPLSEAPDRRLAIDQATGLPAFGGSDKIVLPAVRALWGVDLAWLRRGYDCRRCWRACCRRELKDRGRLRCTIGRHVRLWGLRRYVYAKRGRKGIMCGGLQFTAEDGFAYLPEKVMRALGLSVHEGRDATLVVRLARLQKV